MQTVRAAHGYMGEIAGDFNPMGWNVEYRWGIFPVFRSGHVAANLMLLADIPASLAWARTVMVFEQHKWDTFSQRNRDQKWIKRTHMIGYSKDMMGNLGNTLKGCVDKLRRPNLLISNSNDPRSASSRLIAETSRAVALALKTQAVQTTVFDDIDMTKTLTVTEVHPAGSGWHELSPFLLDMRPLSLSPFLLFPYEIRWVDDRPRVGTEMMVHLVTCDVVGSWPHGVSGVGSARTFSVIGSVGAAFVPGSRFTRPAHSVLPELSGILLRRFRESRVAFFPVKLVNTK